MAGTATATPTPESLPLQLDAVPDAPPRRPRTTLIGTAFAAAGSGVLILSVLGIYLSVRAQFLADGETWLPEGATIPLSPGNMGMATLLMSAVTMQWAVHAATHRDRPHSYLALGTTMLLGIAHVTQMIYLFTQWNVPLNGETTTQGVLLFTVLGLHLTMVVAGLVYILLMTIRSLGGQFTGRDAEGLSAASLYWYVTIAVYSVLWIAVLVMK